MPTQIEVTDADLAALIQAATDTMAKIGAAAEALATAIPQFQADVKQIADAVKAFKLHGLVGS